MFRTLIHFEFIFCVFQEEVFYFYYFICGCLALQQHLLKRLYFPHCILLAPLSYINFPQVMIYAADFCLCVCVCARASSVLFYLLQFYKMADMREPNTSDSVLFSQDCFGYSESLWLTLPFRIICSLSMKNTIGILIGIALKSVDCFGQCEHFNNTNYFYKHRTSFHFFDIVINFLHQCSIVFRVQIFNLLD